MTTSNLRRPARAVTKKKIRGRGIGSGKGRKSGRGDKGQNARSGGGVRLGFEGGQMPLYRRIARRGFSNARFRKMYSIINLGDLEKKYQNGETVNANTLYARGLLGKKGARIKILGTGPFTKKLTFNIDNISSSAMRIIDGLGGTVLLRNPSKKMLSQAPESKVGENGK